MLCFSVFPCNIVSYTCHQMPTVLAKILGVYRIGYRNSHTGRELKQDLLIMENLFYKKKITQVLEMPFFIFQMTFISLEMTFFS